MRRFYSQASSREHDDGGFAIYLDGRTLKTPGKRVLRAPTRDLGEAAAREWDAQTGMIDPETMPINQLLYTALDRVIPDRAFFIDHILAYLDTDLVCYRAQKPPELAERQLKCWESPLDWFAQMMDGEMRTTSTLVALSQPAKIKANVRRYLEGLDDYELTVVQMATSVAGSVVLAVALAEGRMDAASVFEAVHVEENYKSEVCREDLFGKAPQQERREAAVMRDLKAGREFLSLL